MKKVIILLAAICVGFSVQAQNATVDKAGNFTAIAKKSSAGIPGKATGKTFTDTKGARFPVLESSTGKLYYVRTSKAGNEYKVYIKVAG